MKDFQQVFEVAEKAARKYFKNNQDIFLANNYEVQDLIQEAHSRAFRTIKKYSNGKYGNPDNKNPKEQKEILKLSSLAIAWKLKETLRACRKKSHKMHDYTINNRTLPVLYTEENKGAEEVSPDEQDFLNKELSPESLNRENRIAYLGFRFEQLSCILTEEEYDIVTEVIKNSSTFERLSEKYNCTKMGIHNIYTKAIKKIRKYLDI